MKQKNYTSSLQKNLISVSGRHQFNPIRNLNPERLGQILDSFHAGHLAPAAQLWEAIERRDDVIQGIATKRKKSVSRLRWEILTVDNSDQALLEKKALEYFYNNLKCTHATDLNEHGSLSLLIKQMMDAVGKQYAVHEIIYHAQDANSPFISGTFQFVPLWFFERKSSQLHFTPPPSNTLSSTQIPLEQGSWLVTKADGLMEASSIAYLFKHLPLRDWLIYCERNGMPGVKGTTDASPGSLEWEEARKAVEDFGAEFHALMSSGTNIEAIDISSKGTLPYPSLIERMDRALIALWRGSDLTTLSKIHAAGASLQNNETLLLEADDAKMISETLNLQVDRPLLQKLFGVPHPKAYFQLITNDLSHKLQELEICQKLISLGLPISLTDLAERFGFSLIQNQ